MIIYQSNFNSIDFIPKRIISLVPSITELLFDLELEHQVIGITKFCVEPKAWLKTKTIIGGTKKVNIEKIKSLKPDLVIANKEENIKEQVESLSNFTTAYVSEVSNIDQAISMINQIALLTQKEDMGNQLITKITADLDDINSKPNQKSAAYLIWNNPIMTAGGDTYIHAMLEKAGFNNLFKNQKRYPQIAMEELIDLKPEYLLLSSEPFPFKEKHINEFKKYLPNTKCLLVDGMMFSWYGSRMKHAANYFSSLIN